MGGCSQRNYRNHPRRACYLYEQAKKKKREHLPDISQAADLSMNPDPNISIPHAIKATVSLLKTASQQATVKRFVLTSSSTAAYLPKPNEEEIVLTTGT